MRAGMGGTPRAADPSTVLCELEAQHGELARLHTPALCGLTPNLLPGRLVHVQRGVLALEDLLVKMATRFPKAVD